MWLTSRSPSICFDAPPGAMDYTEQSEGSRSTARRSVFALAIVSMSLIPNQLLRLDEAALDPDATFLAERKAQRARSLGRFSSWIAC